MKPVDISIPVSFGKKQLSVFAGPPARKKAYKAGSFIGDVNCGGSCNCDVYTFSPHLNGTHTECVGHISKKPVYVHQVLETAFMEATLITVSPKKDRLVTRAMLQQHLKKSDGFLTALVVRTLPNGKDKKTRNYAKKAPAYFSPDAMRYIVQLGVEHLLVDFPSVDRVDDAKLTTHRIFWNKPTSKKTITELVYVPNSTKDGTYLLNLQVAAFEGDAAPSRPLLYRTTR